MKPKPKKLTEPKSLRQLQKAFVTIGRAVVQLQRRVSRIENRNRVIKGFTPDLDVPSLEVEQDDEP